MALEDFMGEDDSTDDSSDSGNTSAPRSDVGDEESKDDHYGTDVDMEFYGSGNADIGKNPLERRGAMSNFTPSDLVKEKDGDITIDEDNIKFYAPMFTILTAEQKYESGEHHQLKSTLDAPKPSWNGRIVSCIGSMGIKLGKLNKEVVMFNTGSHSKKKAMQGVKDIMGDGVDGNDTIYVNFFGDAMFMRDLAQANHELRTDQLVDLEEIGSRVVRKNMIKQSIKD